LAPFGVFQESRLALANMLGGALRPAFSGPFLTDLTLHRVREKLRMPISLE
jgi:hypothetical protein